MSDHGIPTVLHDCHVAAGAAMTTFGPWRMPLAYTSIIEEHLATRAAAGIFDTCHMGEIGLAGPGALPTLERVFTRGVEAIPPGRARYGFLTAEDGTVVDDCVLYVLDEEHAPPLYILCVNAGDIAGDLAWIRAHAVKDTVIEDLSQVTGKIDVQGPASAAIINELAGREIALKRFEFVFVNLGKDHVMLSRSGYTGENGYEIFLPAPAAPGLWRRLLEAGRPHGLVPAGLGARDTLRTEACLPLYGHELSRAITPIEAGMVWAVFFEKEFIGKERLLAQVADGPARCCMPFLMRGRAPARPGCPVYAGDVMIGEVTSGTYLPSVGRPGGMCLVQRAYAEVGRPVEMEMRARRHEALLSERPLFTRRPA